MPSSTRTKRRASLPRQVVNGWVKLILAEPIKDSQVLYGRVSDLTETFITVEFPVFRGGTQGNRIQLVPLNQTDPEAGQVLLLDTSLVKVLLPLPPTSPVVSYLENVRGVSSEGSSTS